MNKTREKNEDLSMFESLLALLCENSEGGRNVDANIVRTT